MAELAISKNRFLRLTREQWEQMRLAVIRLAPEEACGVLLGNAERVVEIIPVTNILHSPVRFRMDPREQLNAFARMDELGLELIAIYHSHPAGPANPSATDIAQAYYPDAIQLIWYPSGSEWKCRGFLIREGGFSEVEIYIDQDESSDYG